MNLKLVCAITGMLCSPLLTADMDVEEEANLLALFELELTDIATSTRPLDPDLAPGLVLVISSDDMQKAGAQTVSDALSLIPGVTFQGLFTSPIVRGIGGAGSTASGKIKFQLNGQQFNEPASATDAGLLELRTAAVDKIEVIRGPGSSVHGEYALSAVINVVTKKEKFAAVGGGSGKSRYGEFAFHGYFGQSGQVSLVAGLDYQEGQEVTAGPDRATLFSTFAGLPNTGNSPGPVFDPRENKHLVAHIGNEIYGLDFQYVNHKRGTLFGIFDMLADNTDEANLNEVTSLLALSADYDISESLEFRLEANFSQFERKFSNYQAYPRGFLGIFTEGATSTSNEEMRSNKFSAETTWYSNENAITFVGVSYNEIKAEEADLRANFDLFNPIPNLFLPGPSPVDIDYPIGYEDRARYVSSIYAQQELKLGNLNLTLGVHRDRYSDVDSNTSPRIAAVWDFNEHNIVKFGLSEAFRAPTFVELYNITSLLTGAADIKPETVTTSEFAYIYRNEDLRLELSVFDSRYDDVISSTSGQAGSSFSNLGSFESEGVELAFELPLVKRLSAEGYIAYQNSEDTTTGEAYAGTSDWLGSFALNYRLNDTLNLNARYYSVSERHREVADSRDPLEGYQVLNISLVGTQLIHNVDVQLSILNALDEDIRQPSLINTYPEDYPRPGRSLFAEISTRF